MIDYLRRILINDEPLARCSRCRHLWPLSELEDGLCPDCQMAEAEAEFYARFEQEERNER